MMVSGKDFLKSYVLSRQQKVHAYSDWQDVTSSMYALGVLRSHGMCVCAYHFCSRSFSQSSQSSPTLLQRCGFSTSADRQRIETFLRRAARSGLWESATTAEKLVGAADERLFWKLRHCRHHVLDELLPPKSDTQHNLRKRRHDLTLPEKKGHQSAKNSVSYCCIKKLTDMHIRFLMPFTL